MKALALLSDYSTNSASTEELDELAQKNALLAFYRSDGWVMVGVDEMRDPYDRRGSTGRTGIYSRVNGPRNRAHTADRTHKKGGIDMVEKRNDDRIAFISMGMVDGSTEKISCRLENISSGGALVRTSSPVPGTLQKGAVVHLKAFLLSPVELQCKVVRIDADLVAMQFIDD